MTRFLSESLTAPEPRFGLGLRRLERANGNPSADIRLTVEVKRDTRRKLAELGLHPDDTTAAELYHALQTRVKLDDIRLTTRLRTIAATHVSAEGDVVAGMAHALQTAPLPKNCFALKAASLRTIIKKLPPKKALKQLGYRSLPSMLKHESAATILTAAVLTEHASWYRNVVEAYKRLTPADFENRPIAILHPTTSKWRSLAASDVAKRHHNIMSFPELGAIVLLPLPDERPAGAVTASLVLALHALNEVRASSTFLKLCQVRPDFGHVVATVATSRPELPAGLFDQSVPWHLVQRYYARWQHLFNEELFAPHIRLEDLSWHNIEDILIHIEPSLKFWQGSAHLGVVHNRQPVSLNLIDVALNYCNRLPFEQRSFEHFQRSLWQELSLRYLQPQNIEQAVLGVLQPKFAPARALIN
ncbi:MAG: hypothetical protein ABI602_01830 [Candidatus Saccharibacteria bacterium]